MIDIILTVTLGSLAGVASYLSCATIWKIKPASQSLKIAEQKMGNRDYPPDSGNGDLSEGAMLRLSVNIRQQELALTKDGTTVTGSYVNIERNRDGMQTCNKIFLN